MDEEQLNNRIINKLDAFLYVYQFEKNINKVYDIVYTANIISIHNLMRLINDGVSWLKSRDGVIPSMIVDFNIQYDCDYLSAKDIDYLDISLKNPKRMDFFEHLKEMPINKVITIDDMLCDADISEEEKDIFFNVITYKR